MFLEGHGPSKIISHIMYLYLLKELHNLAEPPLVVGRLSIGDYKRPLRPKGLGDETKRKVYVCTRL